MPPAQNVNIYHPLAQNVYKIKKHHQLPHAALIVPGVNLLSDVLSAAIRYRKELIFQPFSTTHFLQVTDRRC